MNRLEAILHPMTLTYAWRDNSTATYWSGGGLAPVDTMDRLDRAILRELAQQVLDSLDAAEDAR